MIIQVIVISIMFSNFRVFVLRKRPESVEKSSYDSEEGQNFLLIFPLTRDKMASLV